ncbi:MAG: hypothetical protein GY847_06520 [Proteobacteria bacterium]|nr:hypothetical protein [Pseudomonadota bacterium]
MSNLETSRVPSLEEVIEQGVEYVMGDRFHFLPGKILSYSAGPPQIADVEILNKIPIVFEDAQETVETFPVLREIPVLFPHFGKFFISFPFKKGDYVAIQVADYSQDRYLAGQGAVTNVIGFRRNDLSDACIVPLAFSPLAKHIKEAHADNLVIGVDEGGMQLHFDDSGSITVTFEEEDALKLENTGAETTLAIGDGTKHAAIVEYLETMWTTMVNTFGNHVHPTGVGPSGVPTPSIPAWDSNINSTKVSLPDG